jgi:oligopeptide transport system substrate-binding protein
MTIASLCRAPLALVALIALVASLAFAAGAAHAETVLHRGNGSEPQSLDPAHVAIDAEANIVRDLYEGLTTHDVAGKVVPGVAESWTVSPDGLVYTFTIRADARWSNGDPVTADDFVFAFQRIENPKVAASAPDALYPIRNAVGINRMGEAVDTLGVRAVDARTLAITLEQPTPWLPELLAGVAALPVHKASVTELGSDFVKPGAMISNGAFTLTEAIANDHVTLAKNPQYWDAAHVALDTVIFYPTDDQIAAVRRFEAGELDLNAGYPTDEYAALTAKLGKDVVRLAPSLSAEYCAFDTRRPPFDDVRVRQALSMAIDRDALSALLAGAGLPLASFVPPGIAGYSPATADFAGEKQAAREAKARELLQAAGYGEGGTPLAIELRYNAGDAHRKVATAIAATWKTLGASVTLTAADTKAHYAALTAAAGFDAARIGWTATYADPQAFLAPYASASTPFNYTGYAGKDYDALLARSSTEADAAARMKTLHDAEAILARDQPAAPLLVMAAPWLVAKNVTGWQDNTANDHRSRYLDVK